MAVPFGAYDIQEKLASGGMGEVFLALRHDPTGTARPVALKLLLPEAAEDPEFVNLFFDEARIASYLSHPNICEVYELGVERGRHYLAMELVAGQTLARIVKKGKREGHALPPLLAAYVISEAAEGLAAAHEATDAAGRPLSIVHRDVSPQNIMVTYDGRVKVLDFGIAHAAHRRSKTRTGEVRGKVSHMSPEHIRGEPLDARADVFALGVLLYELCSGLPLFARDSDVLTMQSVLRLDVPALEGRPGVPAGMDEVLRRGLAKQRDDRYPTARAMVQDLRAVVAGAGHQPSTDRQAMADLMAELFAEEAARHRLRLEGRGTPEIEDAFLLGAPSDVEGARSTRVTVVTGEKGHASTEQDTVPSVRRPRRATTRPIVLGSALALVFALGAIVWGTRPVSHVDVTRPPPLVPPVTEVMTAPASLPDESRARMKEPTTAAAPMAATRPSSAEGVRPPAKPLLASSAAPRTKNRAVPLHRPASQEARERAVREAPSGMGRLTFDSYPWTEVYLNGRKLGTTPLIEVSVPAGQHHLRAVNLGEKIDRTMELRIVADQTTSFPRFNW